MLLIIGGIGTCVASQDISAKSEADLMFYTGKISLIMFKKATF